MELIKNKNEVIAKIVDEQGIYKIGLGVDSLMKSDDELKTIAQQKYDAIKFREANPPPPTYQELREKEYLAQGITEKEMIIALWEKIVEGKSIEAGKLQAERLAIKQKYPKG